MSLLASRDGYKPPGATTQVGKLHERRSSVTLKRKGGLVIGVTSVLFGVPFRILESVWPDTWSKVNRYPK